MTSHVQGGRASRCQTSTIPVQARHAQSIGRKNDTRRYTDWRSHAIEAGHGRYPDGCQCSDPDTVCGKVSVTTDCCVHPSEEDAKWPWIASDTTRRQRKHVSNYTSTQNPTRGQTAWKAPDSYTVCMLRRSVDFRAAVPRTKQGQLAKALSLGHNVRILLRKWRSVTDWTRNYT